MKTMNLNKIFLACSLSLLVMASSCRKFPDPPLVFEEEPELAFKKDRKVLLVVVEGLNGIELEKDTPPTIKSMLANSKYTFNGLSDGSKDALTWSNILSGQWSDVHNVHGNSFDPEDIDDDDIHDHEGTGGAEGFVSIFQRVNEVGRKMTSAAIGNKGDLTDYAFKYADKLVEVDSDQKVKDSTVNVIKAMDAHASLAVVQFSDVRKAGLANAFSMSNAGYKAAVDKTDGYVKELLDAVKGRSTYDKEDWLIILTSNHGGIENKYGSDSFEELNTFTLYYHPLFKAQKTSADLMNYLRFHGWYANETITTNSKSISYPETGVHAVSAGGAGDDIYNIAKTGELTIEFKINFYKPLELPNFSAYVNTYSFWYQNILSKDKEGGWVGATVASAVQTPGWSVNAYSSDSYGITLQDGKTTKSVRIPGRKNQTWQHVAITLKKSGTKTMMMAFVDGIKQAQEEMEVNVTDLDNIEPIILGFSRRFQYGLLDFYMTDVRFWNKALADSEVSQVACLADIPNNHALNGNLISAFRKSEGNKLKDAKGNAARDLSLTGTPVQKTAFNYTLCSSGNVLPYSLVDIAPQIYYWLDMPIADAWLLSSKPFLNNYEVEFMQEQTK
ncbi:LamG-like jellyroll fold domain-containing protein [Sphingobacterium lactis]|uniref:LamG-like jellyroll fold domain-containing protein n=1 Tax=Sphingobacterium lactis TaxID=797291 RepID=UPI003F8112DC